MVLQVLTGTDTQTLFSFVVGNPRPGSSVYTDEWRGYSRVRASERHHATVNHSPGVREWARDNDGVREVHTNTIEGLWAGLRTYLRPFRGVSKHYLVGYVAVFQWVCNLAIIPGGTPGPTRTIPHPFTPWACFVESFSFRGGLMVHENLNPDEQVAAGRGSGGLFGDNSLSP